MKVSKLFAISGVIALLLTILFGGLAALQFVYPDFLKEIPFYKARPLHVTLAVTWIFSGGISACYRYFEEKELLKSRSLQLLHWGLFNLTFLAIIITLFSGKFGGREYWAFPPFFSIPILISWIIFAIQIIPAAFKIKGWPVYLWMWVTGIIVFLYTFTEANSWLLDYFSNSVTREVGIQWKSYGSLVGSWNMLVYGAAMYIMEKISGDDSYGKSRIAFILFFVGLTNTFFNWAHHVYPVPLANSIQMTAYIVSMTELFILGRIIWKWKSAVKTALTYKNVGAHNLLASADFWVFFNLTLAIVISVPAFNFFAHGTHIVVAHAMGSTIGINTLILFAYLYTDWSSDRSMIFKLGLWITNISLAVFLTSLIVAGWVKGVERADGAIHYELVEAIMPYVKAFMGSGLVLLVGLGLLGLHWLTGKRPS